MIEDNDTYYGKLALRERIAMAVHSTEWAVQTADAMYAWVVDGSTSTKSTLGKKSGPKKKGRGPVAGVKRGPYKKHKKAKANKPTKMTSKELKTFVARIPPWEGVSGKTLGAVKKATKKVKRPYTKKSKWWGKKKKK